MTDVPRLRSAAEEASWLVDRGYPSAAASAFVAEHRALDDTERKLLSCNARLHACVRHHIAREMDPDDARKRVLMVDAASAIATVAAAIAGRALLESAANVHADPEWTREAPLDAVAPALGALAAVFDALRPNEVKLVASPPHAAMLEEAVRGLGKRRYKAVVEAVSEVPQALHGAGFVVSSDPIVLDACATWINAVGMAIERIDPPRLRLSA